MRSIRYRLLLLFLLAILVTWSCYLSVIKSANSNLAQLTVSPPSKITPGVRLKQFVYQKESILESLERASIEPLANEGGRLKRSTDTWSEPVVLLRDDVENTKKRKACSIPQIDPFHDLAMREMQDVGMINCPKEGFGQVVNGSLILKSWSLRYAHIQYIQRPPENDDDYFLSDAIQLIEPIRDLIRPGNRI